jgi:TPR repeat protein
MRHAAIVATLMTAIAFTATAQEFSNVFTSDQMRVDLHAAKGGGYVGTIRFKGQEFPCQAEVTPDGVLEGTFSTKGGHEFPFAARLKGRTLTLTSGRSTYTLSAPPENPLEAPQAPNPLEAAAPEGRTVTIDLAAMKKQFRTAAQAYNRKDYATALENFLPLAKKGHVEAQYLLGLMYQHGRGTEPDFAQAARWYQRAATANHTSALLNLGMLCQAGKGVPQDPAKARALFERGARLGSPGAQRALGAMCFNGEGGPQNAIDGMAWMQLAAQGGDEVAKENVANIRNRNVLSPAQLDAAGQRAAQLAKAVAQRRAEAEQPTVSVGSDGPTSGPPGPPTRGGEAPVAMAPDPVQATAKPDFSTPQAALRTFFRACDARDAKLLSQCISIHAQGEFEPLLNQTAPPKLIDALQAMFKGATITGTDTAGEAGYILLVKLPARGDEEAIELHKDKDGWKILDF